MGFEVVPEGLGARRKDDVVSANPEPTSIAAAAVAAPDEQRQKGRMNLLFAILVVVYAQYLFLFDGQEKINQSMPTAYRAVVSEFEGLLGKTDVVRGPYQIDNRRLY